MADSEEFRRKRLKHEKQLSRVFDEVMGLGDFADSSRGSATSSRSGGPDDAKGPDEISAPEERLVGEDTNGSRQEEKTDEGAGEEPIPPPASPSSEPHPDVPVGTKEAGGGGGGVGSGRAAFDDALDGLPAFGAEEDDEDWHFALPMGSLDDADVDKSGGKNKKANEEKSKPRGNVSPLVPREEEEEEEEEEEGEREASSGSPHTSHSSQEPTPENSRDAAVLNQTEETEDSQQGERSEAAPMEDSNPPISPSNIKDEPIDEGYDAALLPQSCIRQIKEELDHQEDELRISSVYSVGGGNAFTSPSVPPTVPAPLPPPTPTAIFIPGRGAVLQAMAPLPIRPPLPVPSSVPALTPAPLRPPQPPIPGSVRCSGCSKVLLKGQTAFQRKGSTQLFCSTVCLTGHLPPVSKNRSCFQCNREILQPRDMITVPSDDGTYTHFCGQFCLSVFRHKKKQVDKAPDKWADKRLERQPEKLQEKAAERQPEKLVCSVCKVANRIEHEVSHQGRLHRLCSDACFVTWRKIRQLAMNCCEGCGLYCNANSGSCHTLTIERSQLNFCGPTCIGTYKQTCRKTVECAYCHKTAVVSSTILERDQKGKVQLYCSPACVEQSRPPRHTLTGAAFPCCLCKVSAVPQYHLAMVDGTIRNFCSYTCVSIYRKSGHATHPLPDLTNGTSSPRDPVFQDGPRAGPSAGASSVPPAPQDYPSSVPYSSHHHNNTSVPPLLPPYPAMSSPSAPAQAHARTLPGQPLKPLEGGLSHILKLSCHQCSKPFNVKPHLFSHQGRLSVFCSKTCCEQYKVQTNILAVCECCKQEKLLFETMSYNQQDVFFCSENCKVLFKHDLTSRNKDHSWHPCSYCACFAQKMLHSHYGGRMEEFCRPHCMSQYTVLYYGMGRCDGCRKQGYLNEKLQCLGSVRNFCDLPCLLEYCYLHFETGKHASSNGTAPQTPHAPAQPHHASKMNPVIADVVSLANGSATQPSGSADAALTGALPTSSKNLDHASTQTDAMRLPAPRRRQMKNKSVLCRPFTMDQEITCQLPTASAETAARPPTSANIPPVDEKVKILMVPVPVPVFIPVPMNMYTQQTPVPMALPLPVPVPLVVPPRNKDVKYQTVPSDATPATNDGRPDDPTPSAGCSGVAEPGGGVECEAAGSAKEQVPSSLPARPDGEAESVHPLLEEGPARTASDGQPPASPQMDLETDFPSGSLGRRPGRQRGVKRSRDGSTGRKRGRRRTCPLDGGAAVAVAAAATPACTNLNHTYGVKAWQSWVKQRGVRPQPESVEINEDILQCDSVELSFALSRFIKEVRRPNGDAYSPDSVFYLCLGIQQYLFLKGRIENIFTDALYAQFAMEITGMLRSWRPGPLPGGGLAPSRVQESFLWECKQLGAYSPIVLLNTLLFFCTRNFHLTTLAQHQSLSFTNFTRRTKPCSRVGKVHFLYFQRGGAARPALSSERTRKRREQEEGDLEMPENTADPLHCPVRLYEFYLSRCPETVKKRADMFYLQPEQNVHTQSSHWYTSRPLDQNILQSMLTRILAVREIQEHQKEFRTAADGLQ